MNPTDNNSTNLIILDEPHYEEYKMVNSTALETSFQKFDQQAKEPLSDPVSVAPSD